MSNVTVSSKTHKLANAAAQAANGASNGTAKPKPIAPTEEQRKALFESNVKTKAVPAGLLWNFGKHIAFFIDDLHQTQTATAKYADTNQSHISRIYSARNWLLNDRCQGNIVEAEQKLGDASIQDEFVGRCYGRSVTKNTKNPTKSKSKGSAREFAERYVRRCKDDHMTAKQILDLCRAAVCSAKIAGFNSLDGVSVAETEEQDTEYSIADFVEAAA